MCIRAALSIPFFLSLTLLTACTTGNYAPVESDNRPVGATASQPNTRAASSYTYTVQRGDTLYRVAQQYGLTLNQIAALNGISPPYSIYPGQVLRVSGAASNTTSKPRATINPSGERIRRVYRGAVPAQPQRSASAASGNYNNCQPGSSAWQWPAVGNVQPRVASTSQRQGVQIFGTAGQTVRSAAPGRVVYSGAGLNGYYGNLLIIEHSQAQRSIYAHNRRLLVNEGDYIPIGHAVAEMGQNQQNQFALYFEISCFDKTMNPLLFLPRL
ncbi:MAG: peptidoglycan DD-metalloendopeptidase family protein [Pseudomonadota bacterium]